MPLPVVTCPNCRVSASLDVFLSEDSVRDALNAVIAAHPAGETLIKPMLRYIGLLAPAKSRMAYSRLAALIGEITPAMRAAQITRGGRTWPAPLAYWQSAFEAVLNAAHQGGLSLPLKSHGYLLEVIARMASQGEAKAETLREQQRAGHAGVGAPPERAQQTVVSHEPTRTGMPVGVRENLQSLKQRLRSHQPGQKDSDHA